MLILPFALLLGSIAGWSVGGKWRALSELRFKRPVLVLGALTTQVALEFQVLRDLPTGIRFAMVVATYLVMGWWLFENNRSLSAGTRYGLALVSGGFLLNLLAILPNGGMPVSASALRSAGIASSVSVTHDHLSKHVAVNGHTALLFLGDVIPLRWFRSVISAGDILMALGVVLLIAAGMVLPMPDGSADAASAAPAASDATAGVDCS